MVVEHVAAGTILLTEGQAVPGLRIVLTGEVRVARGAGDDERELARLGRGAVLGELSLLDDGAVASATVTVVRDTELVAPRHGTGADLLDDDVVGPVVRAVAARRRAANRVATIGPVRMRLVDGTTVDLRPMWPDDWVLMEAGRARTSRASLHQRFFSVPKLTESLLRRLATIDFVTDFAWVALDPTGTPQRDDDLLAVGRYARLREEPDVAEVALLVGDDLQGRGLGAVLLAALAVAARAHGAATFSAVALAENRRVQRLFERAGATWQHDPDDPALVTTRWPVADVLERLADEVDVAPLTDLVARALAPAG